MPLKPLNGNVYIIEDTESVTQSGIVLTKDIATESTGIVFAVGKNDMGVKKGSRVHFSKYVSEDSSIKGEDGKKIEHLKVCPIESLLGLL